MTEAAAAAAAAAAGGAGGDGKGGAGGGDGGGDPAAAAAAAARAAASGGGGGDAAAKAAADAAAAAAAKAAGAGGEGADKDWRATGSRGDEKRLGLLNRYAGVGEFADAYFALKQRLDSGELKAPLSKDATPEQLTAWRKDNGIPEKPEEYMTGLPEAVAKDMTDEDRAIITPYLSIMHKHNLAPTVARDLIAARQAEQNRQIEERTQADETLRVATEDTLRAEWGNDYRPNINIIKGFFGSAPEEVRDAFMNARGPDGNPVLGTPEALRWLAQMSRSLRDVGAIVDVGGSGADVGKGIDARIAELNAWMGAPNGSPDYKKYWGDPKVQAEYRDLLNRQEQIKRRAA